MAKRVISDIYNKYRIPSWLADHMYRVTAVAKMILDAYTAAGKNIPEYEDIIISCLLHDMGNVIKFNFDTLLLAKPEDRGYWEEVKREMIEKYGKNEHHATLEIVRELEMPLSIQELVDSSGFEKSEHTQKFGSLATKIIFYSDMRVAPLGVVSLQERLDDMHIRYRHLYEKEKDQNVLRETALSAIEQDIFAPISLTPRDITENSTSEIQKVLHGYEI